MPKESYFSDNINHDEIKGLYTSDLERADTVYAKLKIHNNTAKIEFLSEIENELINEMLAEDQNLPTKTSNNSF